MGRPERPLDPADGPVQKLAQELRELRRTAGSPSYRTMAKDAGFSVTTLSQAAAGERLPSLAVLQAYARACGADPAEWERRWKEADAELADATCEETEETPPPYRGLARYEADDQELFFGRDRVVEQLGKLVCDHRVAVLCGPSGSGKSSLLRAGLIPRLREEIAAHGHPAVLRILTPGPRPATTYGHLLTPAENEPASWVVVDQFEEVFTLCRDPEERSRFMDLLLAARDPAARLRVLIAVRADFYVRCAEHRGMADALSGAGLLLGPMTADELREAVTGPAQAAGLLVERELTARLVDEMLDEPGGLPMLSHALLETWRRRRGRMLTLAGYEAAGGVRGAIAASADTTYESLDAEQARAARLLLLRMVEPGQGTSDTRRPLTRPELAEWAHPHVPVVMERLARARLLTVDEDGAQFAHEALLTCWPRLHRWIEEDRERLRHHRGLTEATQVWLDHDRCPGTLYRGTRLARAEELFPDPELDPALTATERAFLLAALDTRDAEERTVVHTRRRSRILTGAMSVLLMMALVVGLAAWQQYDYSQRGRTEDSARRTADVADSLRTTDPRAALLLGVAGWHTAKLPETHRALLGSLVQSESDAFTDPAPGTPVRYLANAGRTLVSVDNGTWRTWDVRSHRRVATGRLPADAVTESVAPDARTLVLRTATGIRLWDMSAGHWTGAGAPLPIVAQVSFAGDGHTYLVENDDRVELRAVADGKVLFRTRATGLTAPVASTGNRLLAVCPARGGPQVWDTGTGRAVHGPWERSDGVCDSDHSQLLLFGPGDRLATVTDTRVTVWDVRAGRQLAAVDDEAVTYASFSGDGTFLATADATEIRIRRLTRPDAPVFRHALNNQYVYGGPAWDAGGRALRYLEGGTVHTVDVGLAVTPAWRDTPLDDVRLSPDGRAYVTARRSGGRYLFQIRATADGRPLGHLPPVGVPGSRASDLPADAFPLTAFSPDGTALAYGVSAPGPQTVGQTFTVWDTARRRVRGTLDLTGDPVLKLALGPGGHALYAARNGVRDLYDEAWDTAAHHRTAVLPGLPGDLLTARPGSGLLIGDGRLAALPSGRGVDHDLAQGAQIAAAAFSADGSLLAVGDGSGRVTLWDGAVSRRAGVLRNVFPAPLGPTPEAVSAVAVSSDGRMLAVGGSDGGLQLWDVETRRPLGTPLATPGDGIESLAFSPDGTTLYAGSPHVPLQRYVLDPERAVDRICARAGTGLTRGEWRTYVPNAPYRQVCGISPRDEG
ncbi:nSTAND1 domain-containing NTPase [Streptomyces turgidiscabies]|uniref:WD40 repeat protein/transcriptional regulator with XRE-family HTH domain n=1 Tax=Streptomyces turgidiscabies TaxID=85558 RepID=A0ABU0RGU7_9ACTN|nr:helix-turn-helix domain-containing protein [Streptomyces turgidiscabies]MDQ0931180.1 WD40 repeat protein/transcriptional regulator with XRE-family HTH domain [Streptomyces turgidiscabies]